MLCIASLMLSLAILYILLYILINITDECHTINLRLLTTLPAPPEVRDYEVPAAVADIEMITYKHPQLDLTIRKVCIVGMHIWNNV